MSSETFEELSNPCPNCGLDGWTVVRVGIDLCRPNLAQTYKLTRCNSCGHVIQNPQPTLQDLDAAYSVSEGYAAYRGAWMEQGWPLWKLLRIWTIRRRMAWIRRFGVRNRMLEVGCGAGDFMVAVTKAGWEASGVEYNPEMVSQIVNGLGYDVRVGGLSRGLWPEGAFSMVAFWNVLEHVPDPLGDLLTARSYLGEGGRVIVNIPTKQSAEHGLWFGGHWAILDFPRHLNFYDRSSLTRLFSKAGFELIEYKTPFIQSAWSYYMSSWIWANNRVGKLMRWPVFVFLASLMTLVMPYVALEAVCGRGMEATAVAAKR